MDGKCSENCTKENGDYRTCWCRRMLDCVADAELCTYCLCMQDLRFDICETRVQIIDGIL